MNEKDLKILELQAKIKAHKIEIEKLKNRIAELEADIHATKTVEDWPAWKREASRCNCGYC